MTDLNYDAETKYLLIIKILNQIIINGSKYDMGKPNIVTIKKLEDFRSINKQVINNYDNLTYIESLTEELFSTNLFSKEIMEQNNYDVWSSCNRVEHIISNLTNSFSKEAIEKNNCDLLFSCDRVEYIISNLIKDIGYKFISIDKIYYTNFKYKSGKYKKFITGISIINQQCDINSITLNNEELNYKIYEKELMDNSIKNKEADHNRQLIKERIRKNSNLRTVNRDEKLDEAILYYQSKDFMRKYKGKNGYPGYYEDGSKDDCILF